MRTTLNRKGVHNMADLSAHKASKEIIDMTKTNNDRPAFDNMFEDLEQLAGKI